jgi:hypothetical protein
MVGQTIGDSIVIDPTAAGYGWFTDAQASPAGSDRLDLLTVVLHEFGHVLGHEVGDLASLTLGPGVRRAPAAGTAHDEAGTSLVPGWAQKVEASQAGEQQLSDRPVAAAVTALAAAPAPAPGVPAERVAALPAERAAVPVGPADLVEVASTATYVGGVDRLVFSAGAAPAPAGERGPVLIGGAGPTAPSPAPVLDQVFATFGASPAADTWESQDWSELVSALGLPSADEFWAQYGEE